LVGHEGMRAPDTRGEMHMDEAKIRALFDAAVATGGEIKALIGHAGAYEEEDKALVRLLLSMGGAREVSVYLGDGEPYAIESAHLRSGEYPRRVEIHAQYDRPATAEEIAAAEERKQPTSRASYTHSASVQ
jgi:hypothetical protein